MMSVKSVTNVIKKIFFYGKSQMFWEFKIKLEDKFPWSQFFQEVIFFWKQTIWEDIFSGKSLVQEVNFSRNSTTGPVSAVFRGLKVTGFSIHHILK